MKKISSFLILGVIVLLAVAAYTGYVLFDQSAKQNQLATLEASLVDFQKQDLTKKNQEVLQAITAKKTVDALKGDVIPWSKVMREILKTVPRDGSDDLVDILSYSGTENSEITMNVKTSPSSTTPYLDVAELIRSFDQSEYFENVFVPSISSGTNAEGREVLTFLINARYIEPVFQEVKSVQR